MHKRKRQRPLRVGQPVKFQCWGAGKCVCGVPITCGTANGHPTVLHPMPMCETFERFESPIDYLAYLNKVAVS